MTMRWVIAALHVALLLCCDATAAVEQWGQWEQTWTASVTSLNNPFTDVELFVDLSPRSIRFNKGRGVDTTVRVRGFYDGDGQFRARFMPPTVGAWHYETHSNLPALHGRSGNFSVERPSAAQHGPVVAVPNQTKFSYADGNPFFAVATTVYGLLLNPNRTIETLRTKTPFNKVRMMLGAAPYNPYEPLNGTAGDPTRFNVKFWRYVEDVLRSMIDINVQAELILLADGPPYPKSLACLGGSDPRTYNTTLDILYLRYTVARLASFNNVWWSMANEWSQLSCKWAGSLDPSPCPHHRDPSDPGCGYGGGNSPAWDTPIWDTLFQTVRDEDPTGHLLSIHNNAFLYNYSRPWVTHFSLQHTHNKPEDLWYIYGLKPFMYDEVKYEAHLSSNWGSLSAPQMVDRFWWIAAAGAYGMHGEMLYQCPYWSDSSGYYCGQSVDKIAWFRNYMENTTLHPPFEECVGQDDGYVHTLTCGTDIQRSADFLMFHFYNGHQNASGSFQYIYLPKGIKNRQDLVQPWEMLIAIIWKPPTCDDGDSDCEDPVRDTAPPPPGTHIFGPPRDTRFWEPIGITVDEDTLPHIITFTSCDYNKACERPDEVWGEQALLRAGAAHPRRWHR